MRVIRKLRLGSLGATLVNRVRSEEGFTMIAAIGLLALVLAISSAILLTTANEVDATNHNIEGKRAYAAAQAALNIFLYQMNQNPNYWDTCSDDYQTTPVAIPGAGTSESYSYQPILANNSSSCSNADPITSLIDSATGTMRMEFTGYAGHSGRAADPLVTRTIVASLRKLSPFDYLWYTVYEAVDPGIGSSYSGCGVFLRTGTRPSACNINWITGDTINGPMYTEDQYLVEGSPTFGRNSSDTIASAAPGTTSGTICAENTGYTIVENNCGGATINGTAEPGAPTISPPSSNTQLLTDAQNHGKVYSGITTIVLNGTTATVTNCPSSCGSPTTVDLTKYPIIYVSNGSGCTPYSYSPFSVTYYSSGCYGDVYVSGSYTTPVTIAAANNIIVDGNITTTESSGSPTGTSTLGLIANEYIRVMHGVMTQNDQIVNVSSQTFSNLKIDAALMAVQHSFIVDNYNQGAQLGNLTVNGAIAQYYRGPVGTSGGFGSSTGYIKSYSYDDRLKALLPPYLFDIATSDWSTYRETLCTPGSSGNQGCSQ